MLSTRVMAVLPHRDKECKTDQSLTENTLTMNFLSMLCDSCHLDPPDLFF